MVQPLDAAHVPLRHPVGRPRTTGQALQQSPVLWRGQGGRRPVPAQLRTPAVGGGFKGQIKGLGRHGSDALQKGMRAWYILRTTIPQCPQKPAQYGP